MTSKYGGRDLLKAIDKEVQRLPQNVLLRMPEINDTTIQIDQIDDTNDLNTFLGEINKLNTLCEELSMEILNINGVCDKINASYDKKETDKTSKELNELTNVINTKINTIRSKIKEISDQKKALEQQSKSSDISEEDRDNILNDLRIIKQHYARLSQKFLDITKFYDEVAKNNKRKRIQSIKNTCKLTDEFSSISESDIELILDDNNDDELVNSIFSGISLTLASSMLEEIKNRHNDIVELEKSVQELYTIFLDMAVIVDQQDGMINSVEHSVQEAHDYTTKTNKHLNETEDLQKSIRHRKICICFWVTLIIGIIVLIAVLTI
jgi:t-SNARE complex subunit (syntaxin)